MIKKPVGALSFCAFLGDGVWSSSSAAAVSKPLEM